MLKKGETEILKFWNDTHEVTMIFEPIAEIEPPIVSPIIPDIPTGIKVTVTNKLPNIPTDIKVTTVIITNKI